MLAAYVCSMLMWHRHFVKEELRRIRFVNPAMEIQVNKLLKSPKETWLPEMEVEFGKCFACRIGMFF